MNLREQGFRFYVRPDKQLTRWLTPTEQATDHRFAGWTDVTDWPDEKFAKWITEKS